MGYDLTPINDPKTVAPMPYPSGPIKNSNGRYNSMGWSILHKMVGHAVQLPTYNDGDIIVNDDCRKIAAILDESNDPFWQGHANWWRSCGGCRVW